MWSVFLFDSLSASNFFITLIWNQLYVSTYLFHLSYFSYMVFGLFWQWSYENTKILGNLCLHFARQDGKNGKKTTQLKWPKYQKPKDKNMGWTKQLGLSSIIHTNERCLFMNSNLKHAGNLRMGESLLANWINYCEY